MPTPLISIRAATVTDAPLILSLVRELATYERAPDAVVATAEDFARDGFGERPLFHVLLAEHRDQPDGEVKPAGFAFYFLAYSTWEGRMLFLEDLFVRPEFRGFGVGRTLLEHLAAEATTRGCKRMHWQVLDWNVDAIAFYERLGAKILREWQTVRIDGDALHSMAAMAKKGISP